MENSLNNDTSETQTTATKPLYKTPKLVTIDVSGQTGSDASSDLDPPPAPGGS